MKKNSEVWAEIYLQNLRENVRTIRGYLSPVTKLMAIIKDDAYGHGIGVIARTLCEEGVEYFGVASILEGITLQKYGVASNILVLRNVLVSEMTSLLDHGLTPSITSKTMAEVVNAYGNNRNKIMKVHVRVDTSSEGEGIAYNASMTLLLEIKEMTNVQVEGIYTHLIGAYTKNKKLVDHQLNYFQEVIEFAKNNQMTIPIIHAASSPATFLYPESHMDMVRVGTALYGIPFVGDEDVFSELKPVMEVKSRITVIKKCDEGYSLGYDGKCQECDYLAFVSVGYADLPFLLHAKNLWVRHKDQNVEVVKTPGMDHIEIMMKGRDGFEVGDEVSVFGR